MSLGKIKELINRNKSFFITSHMGLEGDAIGSELALAYLLRYKGKKVVIVNDDAVPQNYSFLNDNTLIMPHTCEIDIPDVVFILDCSDFSRCGKTGKFIAKKFLTNKSKLAAIDHHVSNAHFAQINWVKPRSSSTGEMIYELYKAMRIPFNRKSASALYTALMTDTGSFRYSTTSYKTHQAAAEMLKYNIWPDEVYHSVYESYSYADTLALRDAVNSLRIDKSGRVAWFKLDKYYSARNAHCDQADNILDFARMIKTVEVCFLLKKSKDKNEVRVNLRSRDKIDVSKIAQYFGGGGHKKASGCTVFGTFSIVEKKILSRIKQEFK